VHKKQPAGSAQFHGNERHTGVYQQTGSYTKLGPLNWKFKSQGKIFSSPAIAGNRLYTGSEDSNLYALDIATGTLQWSFHTNGAVSSSPCVYKNFVYFLSYDGHVYAVNTQSGKQIWKFKTAGEKKVGAYGLWTMKPTNMYMEDLYDFFLSSPVMNLSNTEAVLYVGSSDGNLYALNALDGSLKWKFPTKGIIHTTPAVDHNTVYVTSWDTYLYAIDAVTGKMKWKFKTNEQPVYHLLEGIQASPTIADSLVFFGARDGYFYAVNANTGSLVWKFFNDNSWVVTTAAILDSTVYFGTSDTYRLLALDAKTGKEKYYIQANGYVYSSPAIAGRMLYFGDFTGRLYALDRLSREQSLQQFSTEARDNNAATVLNKKGRLDFLYTAGKDDPINYSTGVKVMNQFYTLGSIVSSPVISGNQLFFGSADSCLYALTLQNQ
jgi:outer membrane protein assembly factor BamB